MLPGSVITNEGGMTLWTGENVAEAGSVGYTVTGQNGIAVIVKGAIVIVVVVVEITPPLETNRVVVKAGQVMVEVE
jgi:hypothetical protein